MTDLANITSEEMEDIKAADLYSIQSTGILQPILANRWRIVFETLKVSEHVNILSAQAIRCRFDYKEKTLTVDIEQSTQGHEHEYLDMLMGRHNFVVRVDMLSENNVIHHSLACFFCKVEDHKFNLDYSKRGVAIHQLIIKYKNFRVMELKPK